MQGLSAYRMGRTTAVLEHDRSSLTLYKVLRAIALLKQAYLQHYNAVTSMKVNPIYDPLRNDPRFQDLMKRIGLSE